LATNSSAATENQALFSFDTQSTLSPVQSIAGGESFSHRMAFVNTYEGDGGAAQTHKRNVVFQLDFTVEDAANHGFEVELSSILRGISSVTLTELFNGTGTGTATGANFNVSVDDSTDAPATYTPLVSFFTGTNGAIVQDMLGTDTVDSQDLANASLGAFVGTTSFSLQFTTNTTPTTNIVFGNNRLGFGEIDYGLGSLAADQSPAVDPNELGYFVTVSVLSQIPEPASASLAVIALLVAVWAHGRRKS
jgi:hypothetical protein